MRSLSVFANAVNGDEPGDDDADDGAFDNACSSDRSASAEEGRAFGSLASRRWTSASTAGGTSLVDRSRTRGGASATWRNTTFIGVSPTKSSVPVNASNHRQPSE